jgi:hypothetical protein
MIAHNSIAVMVVDPTSETQSVTSESSKRQQWNHPGEKYNWINK